MRNFNKALVASAILAGLSATSAFAGTEACFEIKPAVPTTGELVANYALASCDATVDTDAAVPAAIAYELTKDLDLQFDAVDGTAADGTSELHITYIPTTDIPGGTLITMQLSGAEFSVAGNQIYLIKDKTGEATDLVTEAVASTDGQVDGESSITFLTNSGVTIVAGTRLAFSTVAGAATPVLGVLPVGVKFANTACTNPSSASSVKLMATSATTDGGTGFPIAGGKSDAFTIVDTSAQFFAFHGGSTAEVEVNAESADSAGTAVAARTEFVYDVDAGEQLVAKQYEAIYKTAFYNRGNILDRAVTLAADDVVNTKFVATSDPLANVKMALWNARKAADGTLLVQENAETGTALGVFGLTEATATSYATLATDLFTPEATGGDAEPNTETLAPLAGALYNEMFYTVTNTVPGDIMNFNYDVNTHFALNFTDATQLDHCDANVKSHQVGVNGAVLKVPYVMEAEGNFVRVTNEHDTAAEVTVDVFGESADGTATNRKVTAVSLGTVPAKSSVVYLIPEIIAQATSQKGYVGADGGYAAGDMGSNTGSNVRRHSVTFTVTAPRDLVHGVSVQKILGGVDRVLPVLDQNAWSQ